MLTVTYQDKSKKMRTYNIDRIDVQTILAKHKSYGDEVISILHRDKNDEFHIIYQQNYEWLLTDENINDILNV